LRYLFFLLLSIILVSCNDKETQKPIKKPEPIVIDYGLTFNDFKVVKDSIKKGDTFGSIIDKQNIGDKQVYVHLINLLPITSITETLFDQQFVAGQYKSIMDSYWETEMAWRGYLVCNHAIIDPAAAWMEAKKLVSYQLDSGISLSQVLYFIGTRPPNLPQYNVTAEDSDPSCSANPQCAALNLVGDCCPANSGVFLGCCR